MAEKFPDRSLNAGILARLAAQQGIARRAPDRGYVRLKHPVARRQSDLASEQPAEPEQGEAHVESPEPGSEGAETDTDRIGAYDPLIAAREDHEVIVGLLSTITRLLQGVREEIASQLFLQEQQRLVVEQLLAAVQQERLLIDELLSSGTNQGPGLAYAASTQAAVIDAETADAAEQVSSSVWEKIKAEVKRVLARLWSMISKLVTVKEWALSGKVGTPGPLLGLAEASVSVTFGR